MARGRKRKDWTQRVFKYWVRPHGELPQHFWDVAKRMQHLWNQLVVLRERTIERIGELGLSDAEKKETWKAFDNWAQLLVACSGLNWECGPAVLDRFKRTTIAAAKGMAGWPKTHHRLDRILIPHRFTGGGAEVKSLFSIRANRVQLRPVSATAYHDNRRDSRRARLSRGRFGLDTVRWEFDVIQHRPLPDKVIVKNVAWQGRRTARGWDWHLLVQIEEQVEAIEIPNRRSCGLDIGWRRMPAAPFTQFQSRGNETWNVPYLRVAMITDDKGPQEIRLPMDVPNAHARRHNLPSTYDAIEDYQSKMGSLTEAMKDELRTATRPDDLPQEVREALPHLAKMRESGLRRIHRSLRENNAWNEMIEKMDKWHADYERVRSFKVVLTDRLKAFQKWWYRQQVLKLVRAYDKIAIEGDLSVARIAQMKPPAHEWALRNSRRFRQWAAPAEFIRLLREYAKRYSVEIVEGHAMESTMRCSICDAAVTTGAALMLTCANGHTADQDVNAADNLRSEDWPAHDEKPYLLRRPPEPGVQPSA